MKIRISLWKLLLNRKAVEDFIDLSKQTKDDIADVLREAKESPFAARIVALWRTWDDALKALLAKVSQ